MKPILINHKKGEKIDIKLSVKRVEPNVWYDLGFYKHHYLTSNLNKSCKCLLFTWNNIPVGFVGLLNTPRKGLPYDMSISRIVILPDFQGLGLSSKIINFCGGIVKSLGDNYRLLIKTIHELMGEYLTHSDKWTPTAFNGKERIKTNYESGKYNNRLQRKSYCFKYIGETIYGYENLLKPINELRKAKPN